MDRIKEYYDQVKSTMEAEDILQYVKETPEKNAYKKRILRTAMGLGTAAAVFCISVLGVGAAGLLDFNEIFGTYFQTKEVELSDELPGMVTEENLTMPNEDYAIVLSGVSGSNKSVIFNFEVMRKDRKPVIDYFVSDAKTGKVFSLWECAMEMEESKQEFSHIYQEMYVNDAGNISVFVKCDQTDEYASLAGKKIVFKGGSFFDFEDYENYCRKKGVPLGRSIEESKIGEPLLTLDEWKLEFVYQPTQKAVMSMSYADMDFSVPFYVDIVEFKEDGETIAYKEPYVTEITLSNMELSCTGGVINFVYQPHEIGVADYTWNMSSQNDICIITTEGEQIPLYVESGVHDFAEGENIIEENIFAEYRLAGDEEIPIAVDIEKISSISFNGETCLLEK